MSSPSSNLLTLHANCLPVGTVIADFEIIGLIGEGGFGIVYLARDLTLDRVVALKEFMPAAFAGRLDGVRVGVRAANHLDTYQAGLRSFINEARMLAKFAHPALVEVYRFWEDNGTAYMVMRFYQGETLRQQLSRADKTFDEHSIAQIMAPIFDALAMLHREQVYHRDIAPDNIMLSDGRPVLLDFGSARRIIGDATQALTTVLKPGYAPVEQYVDDGTMKQGPWTDVYALGGVLYHLATGKAPLQAVSRLLSDPLPTVNEATNNAFSPMFSDAVAKAMAVRVEDRLCNVKDLSDMLGWNTAQVARVVTLPSASLIRAAPSTAAAVELSAAGEKPVYPPEARSASRPVWIAITATGVLATALVGYLMLAPSRSTTPAEPQTGTAAAAGTAVPVSAPVSDNLASTEVVGRSTSTAVGIVNLNIRPWGTVVIDGVTRGISNASQLRQIELSAGTHTIEIAKPDAAPVKQTIEVGAAPLSITHNFK